ncbi:MAG: hypothetical protein ACPGN3_11215 [Opitutales bacterium]
MRTDNSEKNDASEAKPLIGPSTGWLDSKVSSDFLVHDRILRSAGASAAEVVWKPGFRNRAFATAKIYDVDYLSLHLNSFTGYENPLSVQQLHVVRDIREIIDLHEFKNTTAHPDAIPPHVYGVLAGNGIPVSIENMDRMKHFGRLPEEIESIIQTHHVGGVLDLHHAYELSKDMGMPYLECVQRLFDAFGGDAYISHIHLSGELNDSGQQIHNHAQVTRASNREEILGGLKWVINHLSELPAIILEGDPLPDVGVSKQNSEHPSALREGLSEIAASNISAEIQMVTKSITG